MTEFSNPRPVAHRPHLPAQRASAAGRVRREPAQTDRGAAPALTSAEPEQGGRQTVDTELDAQLAAARAGDQLAFAALYRDTQPRLLRYAGSLVGQDAEDVTAEAWLQIARDLHRFSGDLMGFRGWTATIVRNRAFDHLRAMQRRPTTPLEDFLLDRPSELDTAALAADNITTASALRLIASLPPDQAEAVLLRTVLGLDGPAAAAILGKRPGAVRVATHRGLKTLGRLLDEQRAHGRHRRDDEGM